MKNNFSALVSELTSISEDLTVLQNRVTAIQGLMVKLKEEQQLKD